MGSMLASCALDREFDPRSGQPKDYNKWYLLLLLYARSIKKKEQRLVCLESG